MEDTSWISGIFANPFLRGLLIGLFIALVLWVRGLLKVRDLNSGMRKLREHLHTKLEIDSAENERRIARTVAWSVPGARPSPRSMRSGNRRASVPKCSATMSGA